MDVREWLQGMQIARQTAMLAQEDAVLRDKIRYDLKAAPNNLQVGDTVRVLFPNVRVGTSKKLAIRGAGKFVIKSWMHGGRRVARCGHLADPRDEILVHVDRMMEVKTKPPHLEDAWTPFSLPLMKGGPAQARKEPELLVEEGEAVMDQLEARERPVTGVAEALAAGPADPAPKMSLSAQLREVAAQAEKEAAAEMAADKAARAELAKLPEDERAGLAGSELEVESIVRHQGEGRARRFLVRHTGFGPEGDRWYSGAELKKKPEAVEMLANYVAKLGQQGTRTGLRSASKAPVGCIVTALSIRECWSM
jgi:hypothetical protein